MTKKEQEAIKQNPRHTPTNDLLPNYISNLKTKQETRKLKFSKSFH